VATIDFGASPGANEASVAVTGLTGITAGSAVLLDICGSDSTADHSANDHKYLPAFAGFSASAPTAGVGFTIYGRSAQALTGTFLVRWAYQ
jgi:hypothetical protein